MMAGLGGAAGGRGSIVCSFFIQSFTTRSGLVSAKSINGKYPNSLEWFCESVNNTAVVVNSINRLVGRSVGQRVRIVLLCVPS